MEPMTIQELADATGATLLGEGIAPDQTITGVETDSRAVLCSPAGGKDRRA